MTTNYVLGFLFHGGNVALVQKRRGPDVVVGRWNGIGGKVEDSDVSRFAAMEREFKEETGVIVTAQAWRPVCLFTMPSYNANIFVLKHEIQWQHDAPLIRQMEDEPISWHRWKYLHQIDCVPNLHWLIGLCHDPDLPSSVTF